MVFFSFIFVFINASSIAQEKITPIFPQENSDLIFTEGEEAVSTNFNKEPILNYGCSGLRTLQLSRTKGLQAGAPFYAEYVIYVEEGGTFEFWYGGTPPAPSDELLPSYTSPFRYQIDNGEPVSVYREDTEVAGEYTPSYYWVKAGELDLDGGEHLIRFEVTEKRRYDGRYYFYLDNFFLVRIKEGKRMVHPPLPEVFPEDLSDRSKDTHFLPIEDYIIKIRENPEDIESYIEISLVYSLLSDYLNAIKYLKRALILDKNNPRVLLLMAKNMIWKGDIQDGLYIYGELLKHNPDRLDIWMEAGKVAAWTGSYWDSLQFYKNGLKEFEDNLALLVNRGITYLWMGDTRKAEESFDQAYAIARDDVEKLLKLASIYEINGYPDRAITVYETAKNKFPSYLILYMRLVSLYISTGKEEQAEELYSEIEKTFIESEKLTRIVSIFQKKQSLKEEVIQSYKERLEESPDDLGLREILAQTYFWNNMHDRAIEEYHNILITHAFNAFSELQVDAMDVQSVLDRVKLCQWYFESLPAVLEREKEELADVLEFYKKARENQETYQAKVKEALEKGEEPPAYEGESPAFALAEAENNLENILSKINGEIEKAEEIINRYQVEIESEMESFISEEKIKRENFQAVVEEKGWKWDRRQFMGELQKVSANGLVLADFVLGKVYQVQGNLTEAENRLQRIEKGEEEFIQAKYALGETKLWQMKPEEAFEIFSFTELGGYAPHLPSLFDLKEKIDTGEAAVTIVLSEEPERDAEKVGESIEQILKQIEKSRKRAESDFKTINAILKDRMVRTIYRLEENTYLLRNELGDFYRNQGRPADAVQQFKRVLAIDPWDIDATFKLGKVYEWNGNWKRAQKNYQKVYNNDPTYENAAALYNKLAREHADSIATSAVFSLDNFRLEFSGSAEYKVALNSVLGLNFSYDHSMYRLYYPEEPLSARIHKFATGLPISLYFISLEITPFAGITAVSGILDDTVASAIDSSVTPFEFLKTTSFETFFGSGISFPLGNIFFIKGNYEYHRMEETYYPGKDAVFSHTIEADISTSLSRVNVPVLKDLSFRTYGKAGFLDDSNVLINASQELNFQTPVLQTPYTSIGIHGNVVLEHSTNKPEKDDYYSPEGNITLQGGLSGYSWIYFKEGSGLGINLRIFAGNYWQNLLAESSGESPQKNSFLLNGEMGIEFQKGNSTLFLSIQGSGSYLYNPPVNPQESPWQYWLAYLSFGYRGKLPHLLAP